MSIVNMTLLKIIVCCSEAIDVLFSSVDQLLLLKKIFVIFKNPIESRPS